MLVRIGLARRNGTVTKIAVPDPTAAIAGLPGFATAETVASAHDEVASSLQVVGGRYERMAQICRDCVKEFELADLMMPGMMSLPTVVSDGFGGLGNLSGPAPAH